MTSTPEVEYPFAGKYQYNVNLARHTSWRVGGAAQRFYQPASLDDLSLFLSHCAPKEPLFFLGLGSNTLIRDGGIPGTVIALHPSGCAHMAQVDSTLVRVEAGAACAKFTRFCARLNLTGMEFLAGIPGTVGGALAMNAGAHGGETWDHVVAIETVNREGHRHIRQPTEFEVAYRYVKGYPDEYFAAAIFSLEPGSKAASLAKIKTLLAHRQQAQPINLPNGGSVFRNPLGDHAWRLIDACDLKEYRIGGAWVSPKHSNFIVHEGAASAQDIEHLINHISATVHEKTGVHLVREVKIVGTYEN